MDLKLTSINVLKYIDWGFVHVVSEVGAVRPSAQRMALRIRSMYSHENLLGATGARHDEKSMNVNNVKRGIIAREGGADGPRFSICTIVTDWHQYGQMQESFSSYGFLGDDVEFMQIDNSKGNILDAFEATNLFLSRAGGIYIILCHQDVRLIGDGRAELEACLSDLWSRDSNWAVAGNSGPKPDGILVSRITDPKGADRSCGPFPARVLCLDENFFLVRRDANLTVSRDLSGFHMYGADLCLIAETLGYTSYVVDFHLEHLSGGTKDRSYFEAKAAFMKKYERAFRRRWLPLATLEMVPLGGGPVANTAMRVARKLKLRAFRSRLGVRRRADVLRAE